MKTLILILALGSVAAAQTEDQLDKIMKRLDAIQERLDKLPQPRQLPQSVKAKISIDPAYTIGAKDAPLTMVEFSDYQCPFCSRFHTAIFPDIKTHYIDTGKLRYAIRAMPLPIHPDAMIAAEAARCAGAQHHFWDLGHRMFLNGDKLNIDQFLGWMRELDGDAAAFQECMSNHVYKADVEADIKAAGRLDIRATPSFVIGLSTADGVDGVTQTGASPYPVFEQRLDGLLKEK